MKTTEIYLLFGIKTASPLDLFNAYEGDEQPIDLGRMTRSFKDNLRCVMLDRTKHREIAKKLDFGGHAVTLQSEHVFSKKPCDSLPDRFNFFVLFRFEHDDVARSGAAREAIIDGLTPRSEQSRLSEIDVERVRQLFPARTAALFDGLQDSEATFEVWLPPAEAQQMPELPALFTYYTIAGYSLVQLENNQITLDIGISKVLKKEFLADQIIINSVYITNITRRFLSLSQSPSPNIRSVCNQLIEHYRLRGRIEWITDVFERISSLFEVITHKTQSRAALVTQRILLTLTAFTVLSGIFFGIFQITNDSPVVKSGLWELTNPSYIPALLLSAACLLLIFLVAFLWPQSGRQVKLDKVTRVDKND
jgi:hypothetical protein